MANEQPSEQTLHYDPKYIDLVREITAKTANGRIAWKKAGAQSIQADIGAKLRLTFQRTVRYPSMNSNWEKFQITEPPSGRTLIEVAKPANALLLILTGGRDPLRDAIDELFAIVEPQATGDVERVIDIVRHL